MGGRVVRLVLLECGHWFRESGPEGVAESSPRVCSHFDPIAGRYTVHSDRYARTDQGLYLVRV